MPVIRQFEVATGNNILRETMTLATDWTGTQFILVDHRKQHFEGQCNTTDWIGA